MNHTEHTAKTPSPRTGIFATLRARLDAKGISAPSARRPRFALALLTLAAASALALLGSATSSATAAEEPCPNEQLRAENRSTNLPDCRAYEMVTPPYKEGYPVNVDAIAVDGSRMVGWSLGVFAGAVGPPQPRGPRLGTEYGFAREADGWGATSLTPFNPQFHNASVWYTTSADASRTLWSMPTAPIGQDDYYVRDPEGLFTEVGPLTDPAFGPTVNPAPPGAGPDLSFTPFDGASSDLSHVLFGIKHFHWQGDESKDFSQSLYEYLGSANSEPYLVGVTGGLGSTSLIGQCGVDAGGPQSKFNAISADGETVFFTPLGADVGECGKPQPPVDELFARINESETLHLSAPSSADCTTLECQSAPAADALFQGASRDGSKAFFSSTQQLTDQASEDATAGDSAIRHAGAGGCPEAHENGCNLYLYDFDNPSGENLLTVSAGSTSPHVQGVARISQDGSHVYFVAQGVLTSTPNGQGQTAQPGEDNLYVFERDAQFPNSRTSFIATVAPEDEELWGSERNGDSGRPAQTTPDGRFLVFQSHAQLTPDDTSAGVWQVFRYDAQTGSLVRVSVGQNGFNDNGNTETVSATIPAPFYVPSFGGQMPQPLALSDDGSYVVFQSALGLTPNALDNVTIDEQGNKANNVYQWHDGQVSLISTGEDVSVAGNRSGSNVNVLGTSATGADVFFTAGEPILSQDNDSQQDVYDARTGGGFPLPQEAPACPSVDACRGQAAQPPASIAPGGTATNAGPGNRKQRRHRKKHHAGKHHKHKRANSNRRANR